MLEWFKVQRESASRTVKVKGNIYDRQKFKWKAVLREQYYFFEAKIGFYILDLFFLFCY